MFETHKIIALVSSSINWSYFTKKKPATSLCLTKKFSFSVSEDELKALTH